MLNKSGESGHPCLVSDLKGNSFSLFFSFNFLAVPHGMWNLPCATREAQIYVFIEMKFTLLKYTIQWFSLYA